MRRPRALISVSFVFLISVSFVFLRVSVSFVVLSGLSQLGGRTDVFVRAATPTDERATHGGPGRGGDVRRGCRVLDGPIDTDTLRLFAALYTTNRSLDDAAPVLLPFVTTNASDQLQVSVHPKNKAMVSWGWWRVVRVCGVGG